MHKTFNHLDSNFNCPHCNSIVHREKKYRCCPICNELLSKEPSSKETSDTTNAKSDSNNHFYDFIIFRRMITPLVIQILFWICVVTSVIGGLVIMFSSSFLSLGIPNVLIGLCVVVFGPVLSRIICEYLIVFFRINETLTDISNTLKSQSDKVSPSLK